MRRLVRLKRSSQVSGTLGILLAALAFAVATAPPAYGQQTPTPPIEQLERRVQSIFNASCARAGCHAGPTPQQGMSLTPSSFYESTVGEPSREKPTLLRVHPGQPDSSYLVHKIEGRSSIEGVQMPFAGQQLSSEEIGTIRDWISRLQTERQRSVASSREPAYPFSGWRLHNLPTTRSLDQGSSLFLISHRFAPPVNGGYDALYGLDGPSVIKLTIGHAFTDRILLTLGRSNESNDVEVGTRYQVAQQWGARGWPFGLSLHGSLNWISESPPPGESRVRGEAFKLAGQASLARTLGDRFGVLLAPGILLNPAERVDGEAALVTLGVGGRATLNQNISVFAEWVPIVSGYVETRTLGNVNRFDSWGGGVQITTGGHVFQIVATNSLGVATDQYLNGGDLDIRDALEGDFRLGFNISRVLNF